MITINYHLCQNVRYNLDTQNALAEWQKGNEEAELQYDKFLSDEYNNWDSLDFEQKMDRDLDRAMNDAEMEAYWAEEDKMGKFSRDEYHEMKKNKKKMIKSYLLCGYSKEFLHLEKKIIKDNLDYYETKIISLMPVISS